MKFTQISCGHGEVKMSIRNILTSVSVPTADLAVKLGPNGIAFLLQTMWNAYIDLKEANLVSENLEENQITELWYGCILDKWQPNALQVRLCPIPQKTDSAKAKKRGQKPMIDFCFWTWGTDNEYFGAECKILNGDKAKFDRYIRTGVLHYLSGRYGSRCSTSAMIGYVFGSPLNEVVSQLTVRINNLRGNPVLQRDMQWPLPHYRSNHIRQQDFYALQHMFFEF